MQLNYRDAQVNVKKKLIFRKLDELGTFAGVQGDDNNMNVEMLGVDTSTDYGKKFVDTYFDVIKYMGAHDYVENDIVKIINITISQLCRTQTVSTMPNFNPKGNVILIARD